MISRPTHTYQMCLYVINNIEMARGVLLHTHPSPLGIRSDGISIWILGLILQNVSRHLIHFNHLCSIYAHVKF